MYRSHERQPSAAGELFARFGPRVYGVGLRYLHDPDAAAAYVERAFVPM